jgi:hypothetical protein
MRALVLSHAAPDAGDGGYNIAVISDLKALRANGIPFSMFCYAYGDETPTLHGSQATIVRARPGGRLCRLIRSYITGMPGSVERYYSHELAAELRRTVKRIQPAMVIIEDLLLAGWAPLIREVAPNARLVLRSHDVMENLLASALREAAGRLVWFLYRREYEQWVQFERAALAAVDVTWAITKDDADRLRHLYKMDNIAELPVAVDIARFARLSDTVGDHRTVVQVGGLDFRRKRAVERFVRQQWPEILRGEPDARLLLAGRVKTHLRVRCQGVRVLGYVKDELDCYRLGRLALNSQTTAGGIKIKSLTAMAAGRTLVSTGVGVEGMAVHHGEEYWNIEAGGGGNGLVALMRNPEMALRIARAGREWATEHHAETVTRRVAERLLNAVMQ